MKLADWVVSVEARGLDESSMMSERRVGSTTGPVTKKGLKLPTAAPIVSPAVERTKETNHKALRC